jgi:hypothetical protein
LLTKNDADLVDFAVVLERNVRRAREDFAVEFRECYALCDA